jgi:hypothetical protein
MHLGLHLSPRSGNRPTVAELRRLDDSHTIAGEFAFRDLKNFHTLSGYLHEYQRLEGGKNIKIRTSTGLVCRYFDPLYLRFTPRTACNHTPGGSIPIFSTVLLVTVDAEIFRAILCTQ